MSVNFTLTPITTLSHSTKPLELYNQTFTQEVKEAWKTGAAEETNLGQNTMNDKSTLIFVLRNPSHFPWDYALYLKKKDWSSDSPAMVLDPDDVDDPNNPDDIPQQAKDENLDYVLMMQDVDSILRNAQEQKIGLSDDELMRAFSYYLDNDAFIKF